MFRLLLLLFFLPATVSAQVMITEINHNPEGSDSGYEWIEVINNGTAISIDGWKFREANVNHGLKVPDGESFGFTVESGQRFLIVDNPSKFKEVFPDYSGLYYDSSFSLSNSGESLSLFNAALVQQYEITYSSDWVADSPDGSTISLFDQSWSAGNPSPGAVNVTASQSSPSEEGNNDNQVTVIEEDEPEPSTPTYITLENNFDGAAEIQAISGGDRTVIAGAEFTYTGEAMGLVGRKLRNPDFYWNFGDGTRVEKNPAKHRYQYPGEYLANLTVQSSTHVGRDWFTVTVIESPLYISDIRAGEYLEMHNDSTHILEISGYLINDVQNSFVMPQDSFIGPDQRLRLSADTLGLDDLNVAALYYPDGSALPVRETEPETETEIAPANPVQLPTSYQSPPAAEIRAAPARKTTPAVIEAVPQPEPEISEVTSANQSAQIVRSASGGFFADTGLMILGVLLLIAAGIMVWWKEPEPETEEEEKEPKAKDFDIL